MHLLHCSLLSIAAVFLSTICLVGEPLAQSLPNGERFAPVTKLPSHAELPDPLMMLDGRRVTSREQWILRHDVPADPKAYEYYLRGNQFSHDSKQWAAARNSPARRRGWS